MNTQVLENIKLVENDHTLNILVVNVGLTIPIEDIISLNRIGKVTIAVDSPIEASWLVGKVSAGLGMKVVLMRRIPIINYDILIADSFSDLTRIIVSNLKIKYLCFTKFVSNFNLLNYYEFEENSYRITTSERPHRPHTNAVKPLAPPPSSYLNEDSVVSNDETVSENDNSNYEILIKEIGSTEMKYDKYHINYLHPVVPGKISIIMIVTELNNNFAEVIRDIKAQNLASFETIIIDNAAGFRNNVKPNIRYGEKMPVDFCEYHAKELTSGEYIIILNQDSPSFDVMTAINQGQYETR